MSVWRHLLDRIMGPSIREAYLRGFEYGRNSAVNARQMSPDEMPLNELLQLIFHCQDWYGEEYVNAAMSLYRDFEGEWYEAPTWTPEQLRARDATLRFQESQDAL